MFHSEDITATLNVHRLIVSTLQMMTSFWAVGGWLYIVAGFNRQPVWIRANHCLPIYTAAWSMHCIHYGILWIHFKKNLLLLLLFFLIPKCFGHGLQKIETFIRNMASSCIRRGCKPLILVFGSYQRVNTWIIWSAHLFIYLYFYFWPLNNMHFCISIRAPLSCPSTN